MSVHPVDHLRDYERNLDRAAFIIADMIVNDVRYTRADRVFGTPEWKRTKRKLHFVSVFVQAELTRTMGARPPGDLVAQLVPRVLAICNAPRPSQALQ